MIYVALTFDDGYLKQYNMAKLLDMLGVKATFFIITHLKTYKDRSLLAAKPELIQEIHEMRHEIGSHTCTHPALTSIPIHQAENEIKESKKWLEDLIGADVMGFAYPFGVYNDIVVNIVRRYYKYARGTGNFEDRWNWTVSSKYMTGAMGTRHILKLPFKTMLNEDVKLVIMLHNESLTMLKTVVKYLRLFNTEFLTLRQLTDIICSSEAN